MEGRFCRGTPYGFVGKGRNCVLAIFLMRVYLYFLLVFKRRNNSGNRL